MNILAFDLELNQATTGAKIIEIGACVGNLQTRDIIDEYFAIVNPQETMVEQIITLTGITQEMVDSGVSILEAYEGMIKMALKHACIKMPLTWGCGDLPCLKSALPQEASKYFGRREIDAKTLYQCYQIAHDGKVESGLAKSMQQIGLTFAGRQHRALNDAKNTFIIFAELLQKFNK